MVVLDYERDVVEQALPAMNGNKLFCLATVNLKGGEIAMPSVTHLNSHNDLFLFFSHGVINL